MTFEDHFNDYMKSVKSKDPMVKASVFVQAAYTWAIHTYLQDPKRGYERNATYNFTASVVAAIIATSAKNFNDRDDSEGIADSAAELFSASIYETKHILDKKDTGVVKELLSDAGKKGLN